MAVKMNFEGVKKVKKVDLDGHFRGLNVARQIWQGLFDYYRETGGDLSDMDNLLVDYEGINGFLQTYYKNMYEEDYSDDYVCRDGISFMWTHCVRATSIHPSSHPFVEASSLIVVYRRETQTIEFYEPTPFCMHGG